MYIAAKALDDL